MRPKVTRLILAASLLLLGAGFAGCSDSGDAGNHNSKRDSLSEMIVGLQQGMSLVSVRSQLGEPLSESNASGEAALQYKGWLLLFHNNNLERRIRQHWPHHPITRSLKGMLDAKVLALHRGVSVRSVRADLGAPDSYEEVFEATRRPELILRYGPWEVAFVDGKLNRRTNQ